MSNFWFHTFVNVVLFSLLAIYIAGHGFFWVDVILFWLHAMFHTAISCDIDTYSIPTKLLGFLGTIIDKLFGHRKTLHKAWFWTLVYVVLFVYVHFEYGKDLFWFAGGLGALYSHMIVDFLSTKKKAIKRKVKKAIPFI